MANLTRTLMDKVERTLKEWPASRDNDNFLVSLMWHKEAKNQGLDTLKDFFHAYSDGDLTNHDSITRARRKLQELKPELRGESYEVRKNKLEPEMRAEINKYE